MKLLMFITIILFSVKDCYPQFPSAIVYTVVGNISATRSGKAVLLRQHDYIFKSDTLELKKGGMLMLLTKEGKFIDVKGSGRRAYAELERRTPEHTVGILPKYFHLIWEEMFEAEKGKMLVSPESIGGAIGGASRGTACDFMIEPENFSKTANDSITFKWHHVPGASGYQFNIEDIAGKKIVNINTQDTIIILAASIVQSEHGKSFTWISTADKILKCISSPLAFTIYSQDEKIKELREISRKVSTDDDLFIYYLRFSNELGLMGWYKEAFASFQQAKTAYGQGRVK